MKKRKRKKKHYDVEMIKDFLEHLHWEYTINHFENTTAKGTLNPELVDQLAKYIEKYNTCGLMFALVFDDTGCTKEEKESASAAISEVHAERAKKVIDALKSLDSVFSEAFLCAERPNSLLTRCVKLNEFFEDDDVDESKKE